MRVKLGIMLGYAQSTKGYRVWLIDEERVTETTNVRFNEKSRGIDVAKSNSDPARNYVLIGFPSDGDIFSNHDEESDLTVSSGEEVATGSGTASQSSDGITPSIKPCTSIPWIRDAVRRKYSLRTDIYYYVENSNARLRSFNDVKKYCDSQGIEFDANLFNFSSKNTTSGKVTEVLSDISESEEKPIKQK